jgi:hypothetical protein
MKMSPKDIGIQIKKLYPALFGKMTDEEAGKKYVSRFGDVYDQWNGEIDMKPVDPMDAMQSPAQSALQQFNQQKPAAPNAPVSNNAPAQIAGQQQPGQQGYNQPVTPTPTPQLSNPNSAYNITQRNNDWLNNMQKPNAVEDEVYGPPGSLLRKVLGK